MLFDLEKCDLSVVKHEHLCSIYQIPKIKLDYENINYMALQLVK
jgi:hypothetical protein